MTQSTLKMAPYGESNFSILRANNLAYVDKTEFIEKLESLANRFPFIVLSDGQYELERNFHPNS